MQDYSEYYYNLLIWQYRDKPKISNLIKEFVKNTQLFDNLEDLNNAFNLKTALRAQLNKIADFIGLPLTNAIISLNDTQFRDLLYLQTIINNSNASIGSIAMGLFDVFKFDLLIKSDENMSMFYFANLANNLLDIAIDNNLLPKPAGVQINIVDTNNNYYQLINNNDVNDTAGIDSVDGDGLSYLFDGSSIINF
jgi:hypothetical protein